MTNQAKAYIGVVLAAGAAVLGFGLANWRSDDLARFALFLVLFVAAATMKCRVPGITGSYSPVFFFALLGSTTLSFSEVALASALAGVVQSTFRQERRASLIQVLFNAANLVVSAGAAFGFVQRQFPGLAEQPRSLCLILGASVFYFVNTAMVSAVLTLVERRSLSEIWRNWCIGSLPYFVAGVLIIDASSPASAIAVILVVPSILLATVYYRLWLAPKRVVQLAGK